MAPRKRTTSKARLAGPILGLGVLGVLVLLGVAAFFAYTAKQGAPVVIAAPTAGDTGLARTVAAALYEARAELVLTPVPEPRVYIALRKNGDRLAHGFVDGPDWPRAIVDGVRKLAAEHAHAKDADTLELCLPHSRRSARLRADRGALGEMHRGVRGIRISHRDKSVEFCPTQMLTENRSFESVQEDFRKKHGLGKETLADEGSAEQFDAHQLLIRLSPKRRIERMQRGNQPVALSAVTHQSIEALTQGMTEWMWHQVQPDGRMVYLYWPSRGTESTGNNMIRQFMATLCLQRLARWHQTPESLELALRNLKYNLTKFYREDGEIGLIHYDNEDKLGAAALAALSIMESPFREQFKREEAALIRMTEQAQQPDGSFRTFYKSERNDNQNFYPGETLLLWASLLDEAPSEALAQRFDRAFLYYRTWHRENPNPAFIPWHTQAYYKVWVRTKDERLRDFVFEMNDFLADFQEWDDSRYDDLRGRFYDADRPELGPPHASSTGVYIEGLTDALDMALAVKDEKRSKLYARTLKRALRSLMQLQYQDDIDMFYVSKRARVLGGLRTREYDNAIRVDNVQHSLMGCLKILSAWKRGRVL